MKNPIKIIGIWLYWILILYLSFVFLDWIDSKKQKQPVDNPSISWNQAIETIKDPIDSLTGEIELWTEPEIENLTWVEILDIDKVYWILDGWKAMEDYVVIEFPSQDIKYSSNVETDFNTYLKNNIATIHIPEDISWGYLYIRLKKPLKYMYNIGEYQPITLRTSIYSRWRRVYWRLNTKKSLWTYLEHQDFLFNLNSIPITTSKHKETNRLSQKGKDIKIGGYVSDTNGNSIDKILFIWER
jgi:hypothetical protein